MLLSCATIKIEFASQKFPKWFKNKQHSNAFINIILNFTDRSTWNSGIRKYHQTCHGWIEAHQYSNKKRSKSIFEEKILSINFPFSHKVLMPALNWHKMERKSFLFLLQKFDSIIELLLLKSDSTPLSCFKENFLTDFH